MAAQLKMHLRGLTLATLMFAGSLASAQAVDPDPMVSQTPLTVGQTMPGNVVLTPSVEFPTLNSKANLGAFATGTEYTGYFDSYKCYKYQWNAVETLRHFFPVRATAGLATCNPANSEWSGNYLNWAATQTIDPFRKALTGGMRARGHDTATETWLEKANHEGQGNLSAYFPLVSITAAQAAVTTPMPAGAWLSFRTRIDHGGNRMFFTGPAGLLTESAASTENPPLAANVFEFGSAGNTVLNAANTNRVFSVVIRVKVCDNTIGLESNCVLRGTNYKPEGLIQQYQNKVRFSVFGYLVDNGVFRDGGALRARQKYVGPERLDKDTGTWVPNELREWRDDGTFIDNPNPADATATQTAVNTGGADAARTIDYSGVIGYVNGFGQFNVGQNAKNYDPVSEMYYAALRYLRKMPNIDTYSRLDREYSSAAGNATASKLQRWRLTDGFPVIQDWFRTGHPEDDPYQYRCQNSSILGIGDVYTHKDKNLAGNTANTTNEPGMPAAVAADPAFSGANTTIPGWTQLVFQKEGIAYPAQGVLDTGLNSSAYIAGLAYWAHTHDLRTDTDMQDSQTVSTHWVDVREKQAVEPRHRNQYWLAAKYGGFSVPDDYVPTSAAALTNTWWQSTATDTLTSVNSVQNGQVFNRGTNYYSADRPATMVTSLSRAFARIVTERIGSGSSLAANSTRLDTDTRTFQAQFRSGNWIGQLNSYAINPTTGVIAATPEWTAGQKMPLPAARQIFFHDPWDATNPLKAFNWTNLAAAQKTQFSNSAYLTKLSNSVVTMTGTRIVDYIRGVQTFERSQTVVAPPLTGTGTLRTRLNGGNPAWSPILGDIVNSTPVYVGAPNGALYGQSPGSWAGKYDHADFAADQATRTPVVWVGANDGMLHGFNAGDVAATQGREIFAYIPNTAIFNGLANVADPDYEHKYFVDGDIAVADVYNEDESEWRTVLVATMGRGGPGVFALDVTDPSAVTFLWERNAADIAELGRNIGRPVIAQVASGDWRVLFGNGVDSADGTAHLIAIDVFSGDSTVVATDTETGNGLSAVLARDTNADGLTDTVYAGDIKGRLWKFGALTGTPTAVALMTATDSGGNVQPITAAPLVGRDRSAGYTWVFFGTGKFLNEADLADTQEQSWYGFRDTNTVLDRDNMVERFFTDEASTIGGFNLRTLSEGTAAEVMATGKNGWVIDLPASGERMVVPNNFQGSVLVGTTRIPDSDDICSPSGSGFILAINPFTGGRLDDTFFDASRDGIFDDSDKVDGADADTRGDTIVSGIGYQQAGANRPIFVENVMLVGLDDGTMDSIRVQGATVDARRGSWREIVNIIE